VARVVVKGCLNLKTSPLVTFCEISFLDDVTHQAITRLDTKNSVNLALFDIFVPHQSSGVPFPSSSSSTTEVSNSNQQVGTTAIIVGVISSVVVATIFLVKRK
jgi:hypothetical protein